MASMSHYELLEWAAFSHIVPLPNPWLQTGLQCAIAANIHRGKRKPFKPEDFMPITKSAQAPGEIAAILDGLVTT